MPADQRGRYVTALVIARSIGDPPWALRVRCATRFERGLAAPICLTWELTYACNLACTHCSRPPGRRDPNELTTAEAKALIDEIAAMQIFYINIGGGEPMIRRDFFELDRTRRRPTRRASSSPPTALASTKWRRGASRASTISTYRVSIDGVDAATSDRIRGGGSYDRARRAMDNLRDADFGQFKISVVMTRDSIEQLDEFERLAAHYGAELRLTRLRPSGRGVDTWQELHPTLEQNRRLYKWLLERPNVLTGDSFFHLSALGESLSGTEPLRRGPRGLSHRSRRRGLRLSLRHPRRVSRGQRARAGFRDVWQNSELFRIASRTGQRRCVHVVRLVSTRVAAVAWRRSSSPVSR